MPVDNTQNNQLLNVERRVWRERQKAFGRLYHAPDNDVVKTEYDKGLRWGILAAYDEVLSICRDVIDGTPGFGHEQAQTKRCEDRVVTKRAG